MGEVVEDPVAGRLDLFEEMRAVELHERLASERRGHWPAGALLEAATSRGHASLGWDDAGRIILSADWRDWAGIDRLVAIVGMGDYFEIWNPETLRDAKKGDPLIVRAVTRALEARA